MQEKDAQGDCSAATADPGGAAGLLESTDELKINNGSWHVATLRGLTMQPKDFEVGSLKWRAYWYETLNWEFLAAVLLLQGAEVHKVLGGRYHIAGGRARPVYDPKPGFDKVLLVEILENPEDLNAEEVFYAVHAGAVL